MNYSLDGNAFLGSSQCPLTSEEIAALESLMQIQVPSSAIRAMHVLSSSVYSMMGEDFRAGFSSWVKKNLRREPKTLFADADDPPEIIRSVARKIGVSEYCKAGGATLVTHDVDYRLCYENVLPMAELESSHGIKATYNFLFGAGYKIEGSLLRQLVSMGHEVGVHGFTYDLRVAYRPVDVIAKRLSYAKRSIEDLLGASVDGFRNHSLLLTHPLLEAVERAGFLYNSGLYDRMGDKPLARHFSWPFCYRDSQLVEIPVLWPMDVEVFRKWSFSDEKALLFYQNRFRSVRELGGTICLVQHPSTLASRMKFYDSLLKLISETGLPNMTSISFVKNKVLNKES